MNATYAYAMSPEPKSRFNQNLFDGINELIPGNFTF